MEDCHAAGRRSIKLECGREQVLLAWSGDNPQCRLLEVYLVPNGLSLLQLRLLLDRVYRQPWALAIAETRILFRILSWIAPVVPSIVHGPRPVCRILRIRISVLCCRRGLRLRSLRAVIPPTEVVPHPLPSGKETKTTCRGLRRAGGFPWRGEGGPPTLTNSTFPTQEFRVRVQAAANVC